MRIHKLLVFAILVSVLSISITSTVAQTTDLSDSPLMQFLAQLPYDVDNPIPEMMFFDRLAISEAYPEAQMFPSWEAFNTFDDDNITPESQEFGNLLWWRIYFNTASSRLSQILRLGGAMPDTVGFDFFDVDRELYYGFPPEDALILQGEFDSNSVINAFSARGYTDESIENVEVWCSELGCEAGANTNPSERMPENPFGGELGREQPIIISDAYLMSTPSIDVLNAYIDTLNGERDSLAIAPEYIAGVEAISQFGPIIQTFIVDGESLERFSELPFLQNYNSRLTAQQYEELIREQLDDYIDLPPYQLLLFADTVTDTKHIGMVALVYDNLENAENAVDVLINRIEAYTLIQTRRPMMDYLTDSYVDEINPIIYQSSTGNPVLLLQFPTRRGTPEEIIEVTTITLDGPDIELAFPGRVYRFLVQALSTSDLLWLSTVTRAELEAEFGE